MPVGTSPLKLNRLQLRILTIFQQLARFPETSSENIEIGEVMISNLPKPRGSQFYCGNSIVLTKNSTGLTNESVWKALERKGLARSFFPLGIAIKTNRMNYNMGLSKLILIKQKKILICKRWAAIPGFSNHFLNGFIFNWHWVGVWRVGNHFCCLINSFKGHSKFL